MINERNFPGPSAISAVQTYTLQKTVLPRPQTLQLNSEWNLKNRDSKNKINNKERMKKNIN